MLLGNGDGTFQEQSVYLVGGGADAVAVGMSGDSQEGIVVSNGTDDTVSVLQGNGDGTFQPQQVYPVGDDPVSVTLADLTGDNRPEDIIVANGGDDTVTVLMGNGDGTFSWRRQRPGSPCGARPEHGGP